MIVSGNQYCGFIQFDEDDLGSVEVNHQEIISHAKEITSLVKINDEIMATYSMEDKVIKVWRINGSGVECLNKIELKHKAISIQYDNMTKTLAVMDTQCNIGIFQRDYTKDQEAAS